MEDDSSGGRTSNSNGNGKRKAGVCDWPEKADEEDCDMEVWKTLTNNFNQVQSLLDHNKVLIQQVNDNQRSKIPENLTNNVALIREINANISKVVSLYSHLSLDFSTMIHHRRDANNDDGDEVPAKLMNQAS